MLLFSGNYKYSLDDKNRIIIPAKFREILNAEGIDKLYLARGDTHLFLFPFPVFLELCEDLKTWDFTKESNQNYVRLFFSEAFDVTPDKQGRVTLRKDLCEEVGINHEVVLIGVLNRIEIWASERWREFREKSSLSGFSANLDARSR